MSERIHLLNREESVENFMNMEDTNVKKHGKGSCK